MIAVLTGDIVRSTELSSGRLDRAVAVLRDASATAGAWHGSSLRFSRNRGDGWQVCLARPALALRTALYLRCALRAEGKDLSTRISAATGSGDPGDTDDLNAASGPVFVASGRGLDDIVPPATMTFVGGGATGAAFRLSDHVSNGWTEAQARALAPFLAPRPPTQSEVADRLGITRQAVAQALDAAGYPALSDALALIEGPS